MDLASKIINLRDNKGISTYKLAKLSGISQTYMRELEQGQKQPTVEMLSKICSALGITLADFFAEEKKDIPPDLMQLLEGAKSLSPSQLEALNTLIKAIKAK